MLFAIVLSENDERPHMKGQTMVTVECNGGARPVATRLFYLMMLVVLCDVVHAVGSPVLLPNFINKNVPECSNQP